MPRKTLKQRGISTSRKKSNPKKSVSRISNFMLKLTGKEQPDDLMQGILEILTVTELVPEVERLYTFVYQAKTPNLRYDEFPLVVVTSVYSWGFKAMNFHWPEHRQYTWEEIIGSLHVVYPYELDEMRKIPYSSFKINR